MSSCTFIFSAVCASPLLGPVISRRPWISAFGRGGGLRQLEFEAAVRPPPVACRRLRIDSPIITAAVCAAAAREIRDAPSILSEYRTGKSSDHSRTTILLCPFKPTPQSAGDRDKLMDVVM
jgi:hypothetical protein